MKFSTFSKIVSKAIRATKPITEGGTSLEVAMQKKGWDNAITGAMTGMNSSFVQHQTELEMQAGLDLLHKQNEAFCAARIELIKQKKEVQSKCDQMALNGFPRKAAEHEKSSLEPIDEKLTILSEKIKATRLCIHNTLNDDIYSNPVLNNVYSEYTGVYPVSRKVDTRTITQKKVDTNEAYQ